MADALAREGYAVTAPLLPGHGARSARALARSLWTDWVRTVDDAVTRLAQSHGAVVLVGNSLGGLLALDAAARFQTRGVRGVATLGCALQLNPLSTRALRLAAMLGDRMPNVQWPKWRGSDVLDLEAREQNPAYRSQPLRSARELIVGQRAVREALPHLRVPLLAIHGLHDVTAPLAGSIELIERAASRDSALVVLPRSGHLVAVDHDRAEVARQVCAFVHRLAPPTAPAAPAAP